MANTDTFHGARQVFTLFYAYLTKVGQEIGMERATALDIKMCEAMGAAQGKALKAQAGVANIDAGAAASLAGCFIEESLGIGSEVIRQSPQQTVTKVGRCPLYDAVQELGMDSAAIEAMCRAGPIRYMDSMVRQLNPQLSYRLRKFRSSANSNCIEEVVIG